MSQVPTIELKSVPGSAPYRTVLVNAGELFPNGKSLPYPTWIGVIREGGDVGVWTPTASVFRGYRAAAREWLERLAGDYTTPLYAQFPGPPFVTRSVPSKDAPLWWHTKGLSYTASGYGKRIPTRRMIKLDGRWRRVYCCIYSNSGTCYVDGPRNPDGTRGPWITIVEYGKE